MKEECLECGSSTGYCHDCGLCREHCVCDDYDADELGLDPEDKYDA